MENNKSINSLGLQIVVNKEDKDLTGKLDVNKFLSKAKELIDFGLVHADNVVMIGGTLIDSSVFETCIADYVKINHPGVALFKAHPHTKITPKMMKGSKQTVVLSAELNPFGSSMGSVMVIEFRKDTVDLVYMSISAGARNRASSIPKPLDGYKFLCLVDSQYDYSVRTYIGHTVEGKNSRHPDNYTKSDKPLNPDVLGPNLVSALMGNALNPDFLKAANEQGYLIINVVDLIRNPDYIWLPACDFNRINRHDYVTNSFNFSRR